MKKLEIKRNIINEKEYDELLPGDRIPVKKFVNTGFLDWINIVISPFGMRLLADTENDRIYPLKANRCPRSVKAQEKMFRNMEDYLNS